ncbi:MAG: PKD domain-containing protein [bacterium]
MGIPGQTVTFSATASNSPTDWDWDFGTGASPQTSIDVEPEVQLQDIGTYTGAVKATNSDGPGPTFEFPYQVTAPVFPVWDRIELGDAPYVGVIGRRVAVVVADGRLAIAYTTNEGVHLARATVEFPTSPSDFTDHLIAANSIILGTGALMVHSGRLALLYAGNTSSPDPLIPQFAISDDLDPSSSGDWTNYELEANAPVPTGTLFSEGDDLFLCYYSEDESTVPATIGMKFGVATATIPTSISDWDFHYLPDWPDTPFEASIHEGRAIRKVGDNYYVLVGGTQPTGLGAAWYFVLKATTWPPTADTDWEFVGKLGGGEREVSDASLLDIAGHLGVISNGTGTGPTSLIGTIWLGVANDVEVTAETTWRVSRLTTSSRYFFGGSAVQVLDRLVVPLQDREANDLALTRPFLMDPVAVSADASWSLNVVDPNGETGEMPCPAILGDRIAIAYFSSSSNKLMVAIAQTVY